MADNSPQETMNQILNNVNQVSGKIADIEKAQTDTAGQLKSMSDRQTEIQRELTEKQEALQRELAALQQKAAAPAIAIDTAKTIGDKFIRGAGFAEFKKSIPGNRHANFRLELAANPVTTQASNTATRSTLGQPAELGMVTDPRTVLNIESLFPHITIDTGSYQYIKMVRANTVTATGPGVTAEGAAKPESNYSGSIKTGTIETIATWIKMTEQMIADDANIVTFINDDLRQQLNEVIEAQMVTGTGSGQLTGMTASGNYTDYTSAAGLVTGDTVIDLVIKIKSAMEAAGVRGVTLLLNAKSWCSVLTAKNANKDYLIPGIVDVPTQRIWGVPVVLNPNVPDDKFIMGNFAQAGKVIERSNLAVEMDRTGDDFEKNLMTLRMERRLDFAITQPKAITYGDFVTVS